MIPAPTLQSQPISRLFSHSIATLPIAAIVSQVLAALRGGDVLLHAAPGAGKSTGLPLALLSDDTIHGKIVMLEPRRLAARSVAERLASQLGEPLGRTVGLRMRGQTTVSAATRLEVATEGVLTRMLQADPMLEGVALVIFDEFHERSLHADLGLALCLEVQQALRDDLRLLLMSATLDTEPLHGRLEAATQIVCSARQHPVDIVWLGEGDETLPVRAAKAVVKALQEHEGDVLVFLPGVAEIEKTATLLQSRRSSDVRLHRLHSGVNAADQRLATATAIAGQRRVILSTSIAETSITIDGVCVVIDSGLERRGRMDTSTGAQRLETVMASQASATQRSGRAGRTAPGVCYRLWSESGHSRRSASWQAGILRSDLAPLLVELGEWGVSSADDLSWLEPPPAAALARAQDLLSRLGIQTAGRLTAHGRSVARLSLHPRLGHMVLWAAERGAGELACKLAVLLDESDRRRRAVDLQQTLAESIPKHLQRRVDQLSQQLKCRSSVHGIPSTAVVLAQAYPDWIAQRRPGMQARYVLSCGAGAVIDGDDALAQCAWLIVAQLGGSGREARIFAAVEIDIAELQHHAPGLFATRDHLEWDDRRERVVAERQTVLGNLLVSTTALNDISGSDRAIALLSGVRQRGPSVLPWDDECREWQARVQRMQLLPARLRQSDWPVVDDETLFSDLENWLLPWLDGISSFKTLSRLKLYKVLTAMLDYRQQKLLDELLPIRYTVPSGTQIKLRYRDAGNPVLSVKLQEMFGCSANPSIALGHIPLTVELLSPARRPVQITEDLVNFWSNSYAAVKKDMAGRYPKHYWPDAPQSAQPTARVKPRSNTDRSD